MRRLVQSSQGLSLVEEVPVPIFSGEVEEQVDMVAAALVEKAIELGVDPLVYGTEMIHRATTARGRRGFRLLDGGGEE